MYRFVLSRRWIGFALFVAILSTICIMLGNWQLHRLHNRLDQNKVIAANLGGDPVSIDSIQDAPRSALETKEWERVRVVGEYDVSRQVVLKYQTRDVGPGVNVITPLVTSSGRVVLVDRGWMKSANNTGPVTDVPAPPGGPVTLTGWWRRDSQAKASAVEPENGQIRAVSSAGIATSLDMPVYRGYLNLSDQQPKSQDPLLAEPRPEMGQGVHFFYALQWYFFAALAIFGWFFFAWTEAHPKNRRSRLDTRRKTLELGPTQAVRDLPRCGI